MSYFTVNGQNLIPTGTVCSYLGTTDPTGWVICDGTARTDNTDGKYNSLNSLGIGTGGGGTSNYTPPDFRGAFLRGAGTNPNKTGYAGISIAGNYGDGTSYDQDHATQTHTHTLDIRFYNDNPTPDNYVIRGLSSNGGAENFGFTGGGNYKGDTVKLSKTSILNSTTNVDSNETRPYNFSVNWILKL